MRFYFGENGWPKSKLGAAPETDEEKELLVDSLQVQTVHLSHSRCVSNFSSLPQQSNVTAMYR